MGVGNAAVETGDGRAVDDRAKAFRQIIGRHDFKFSGKPVPDVVGGVHVARGNLARLPALRPEREARDGAGGAVKVDVVPDAGRRLGLHGSEAHERGAQVRKNGLHGGGGHQEFDRFFVVRHRLASGKVGRRSILVRRAARSGIAGLDDRHEAGIGLAVKERLKAFARRVDEHEGLGPEGFARGVFKKFGEGLEHFRAPLERCADAVAAGHQIRLFHGPDFEGGRRHAGPVALVECARRVVGDVGGKAQNALGIGGRLVYGGARV